MISSGDGVPGCRYKLPCPTPAFPVMPRVALPVVRIPSLRAVYEFSSQVFSTPFSITTVRRDGTPSSSNGEEPKRPGMVASSMTVTLSFATF